MPIRIAMISAVKASSIVAGMWCRISFSAGSPKMKELPISPEAAPLRKYQYCSRHRLIEAEIRDHPRDLGLIGFGADQHVDWIADDIHAEEHDDRHQQHHDQGLHETPDDEDGHAVSPLNWSFSGVTREPCDVVRDPRVKPEDDTAVR